jgi:16S rRNA (guanine527-N7)-methyltransferase
MSSVIGDILCKGSTVIGVPLSSKQIRSFEVYAAELIKWNAKVNLTAITKDTEVAVKHFIDSLSLTPFITAGSNLLDIGSGAGFPIIPLSIAMPEIQMLSVDAVAKKIHFQRHIIRQLCLKNIEAMHARIEDLHKSHNKAFSIITSRAFTRLDRFISLAAPLLTDDGVLIAMKGEGAEDEIAASDDTFCAEGFAVTSEHHYSLPMGMGERVLTLIKRRQAA